MEVQATTSVRRTSRFCSAKGKFLRLDLTINADPRSRFAVSFHNEISIRVRDVFAEPMCQPETRDRRFHFFFSELEPSIFRNPLVRINFSSLLSLSLSLHYISQQSCSATFTLLRFSSLLRNSSKYCLSSNRGQRKSIHDSRKQSCAPFIVVQLRDRRESLSSLSRRGSRLLNRQRVNSIRSESLLAFRARYLPP